MMRSAIIVITVAFGLAAGWVAWTAFHFLVTPPSDEAVEVIVEVRPGMPFSTIARTLSEQNLITDRKLFTLFAQVMGEVQNVKIGEYKLTTDMLPRSVLQILASGRSVQHQLVIPEGYNIFDIRDLLNGMWNGKGEEFLKLARDESFVEKLTKRRMPSMEGYLFPDTYFITKFTPMSELIATMYAKFENTLKEVSVNPKISMPVHEQVILASIVEKETGAPEERPLIASVYHNRLRVGMQLQADPTIIYGMMVESGEPVKNIRKSDILRYTPYNTYRIKSLPAGPIANPGRDALWAALNPADSKYLYFVSRNDGTHVFSENLKDHNRAVSEFQLDRKARAGKSWRDLKKKQANQ